MTSSTLKKVRITLCVLGAINCIIYGISNLVIGYESQFAKTYTIVFIAYTFLFSLFMLFQYYFLKPDKE